MISRQSWKRGEWDVGNALKQEVVTRASYRRSQWRSDRVVGVGYVYDDEEEGDNSRQSAHSTPLVEAAKEGCP